MLGCVATAQVFTVDTNQSSISISGTVVGGAITNQAPGSLTGALGGTIKALVTANTIQFTAQSHILSVVNGSWQPKSDGSAGSEPADFGGKVNLGFASGVAALRDIQLDMLSAPISVNAGQFDSRAVTFQFPTNATSSLAYNVTGLVNQHGAVPLTGYATNKITALSSLTLEGNQEVLRVPVDATFMLQLVSSNDSQIRLQGQLVATAAAGSTPLPIVKSLTIQGQSILLQWQANQGQQLQIQFSKDLMHWLTNQTITMSAGGTYTWTGAVAGSSGFYRLAK